VFDTLSPADRAATLTVESGSPAATLVDFFPLIRHIPTWVPVISNFKRKALQARDAVENMFHQPYERVKQDIVSLAAFSLSLSL